MFRFEPISLQLDHDVTPQLEVVEEQVQEEVVATDLEMHLAADERKPGTELEQEVGDMLDQRRPDLPLQRLLAEPEEVQPIRILQRLPGQIGVRLRQSLLEVGDRLARPLDAPRLDLHHQDVARPTEPGGGSSVGEPTIGLLDLGEQNHVVAPRQSSNSLLDDCVLWPGLCERPHVKQVRARETLHVREGGAQIMREPFDDLAAVPLLGLTGEKISSDLPVQLQQLRIDLERGLLLSGVDPGLEIGQPIGVPVRRINESRHPAWQRAHLLRIDTNRTPPHY